MAITPIFSLTYLSSAVRHFGQDWLDELLRFSRDKNVRDAITGMLLYKEATFMQVLEGKEADVRTLYGKIERDVSHRHLVVLSIEHAKRRQFSDWSMGFGNLGEGYVKPEGFSDFLNVALTSAEFLGKPERAQKLLLLFKARM